MSVIGFKELIYKYKLNHIKFLDIYSEVYLLMLNILVSPCHRMWLLKTDKHSYVHTQTHTYTHTYIIKTIWRECT